MITIKQIQIADGSSITHTIPSDREEIIDGTGLLMLPAAIDPHVHFRVPGGEHKEDWKTGALAAIDGGVTTVFDMPNNNPACTTKERLEEKKRMIDAQLAEAGIPLRYQLYLGASEKTIGELTAAKGLYIGIKVFLGQSTGDLLMDNDAAFDEICRIAASLGATVAVHSEDEKIMQEEKQRFSPEELSNIRVHSQIRKREAAIVAMQKAIAMGKKYGAKLYILHASTKEEVALVAQAKRDGVNIALETTPHHLFLNNTAYETLGTKAQMNPPLRTDDDNRALWAGLNDGTIDTIGTDHAPHTLEEKSQPYGKAPSGVPGIETMLPLLLTAYKNEKISLEKIVALTSANARNFFSLSPNDDVVLVDMKKTKTVRGELLRTKCKWSPFERWELTGWPVYTIMKGRAYRV